MAMLIYWDRSGAVITESFSYVEEKWLANFFWQYTHSSPAVRGVDESVTTPTDADATYVRKARVALELDDNTPLFKLRYMTTKGIFLIVLVASHHLWAITRQHVEPPVSERCALMKDIRRVSLDGMQTEGAIFMKLVFRIFLFFSEVTMSPHLSAVLTRTILLDGSFLNSVLMAILG